MTNTIYWFRKALRIHDNPSFVKALDSSTSLQPIFCLDPWFVKSGKVGVNRMGFLLESLLDLDQSLQKRGSRLIVVQGNPREEIPRLCKLWNVTRLSFERDTEPYAKERDFKMTQWAASAGVEICSEVGHTLCDPDALLKLAGGKPTTTYSAFCEHFKKHVATHPIKLAEEPKKLPPLSKEADLYLSKGVFGVPSLKDIAYDAPSTTPFRGGETEALSQMQKYLSRKKWVIEFEKPNTDPAIFDPNERSTTVLSPYLKFGCLSPRRFYLELLAIYKAAPGGKYSKPPVSLEGQMLWREFYYVCSTFTPNFDRMLGNPICRQIPWGEGKQHDDFLAAWKEGRTGYPWIDAIMIQLRLEGHMHHLARHCVACFLTRGDLWVSWERGAEVFDELLLDADWALNNGNWMWLSCSCFFYQYFRCYSPVAFPKKYDTEGKFVKHYIPALRKMPSQYIYEPWKAPLSVQKQAGCLIGKDYPNPIVKHEEVSKENMGRMKLAYDAHKEGPAAPPAAAGDAVAGKRGKKPAGGAEGATEGSGGGAASPAKKKLKQTTLR